MSNNIIIGGYFNTPLESIDKTGNCQLNVDVIDTIEHLGNVLQLNDIWRLLHPDIEQFTWRRLNPLSQSRIDYYLISDNLIDKINICDIQYGYKSDHSAVVLELNLVHTPRGPSFWKSSALLLRDNEHLTKLKSKLKSWSKKYDFFEDSRTNGKC